LTPPHTQLQRLYYSHWHPRYMRMLLLRLLFR